MNNECDKARIWLYDSQEFIWAPCRHSRIVGQFFNFWITHRIVIAVASFTIFMNVVILMLVKKFFTVSFSRNGRKKGLKGMFIFARLQQ